MKKLYYLTGLFLCLNSFVFGQDVLVFKGIVKCYISDDERSTRGARNVVVVPGFIPGKSGMTGDEGYYEINTGVPVHTLEDKYISLYYISSCSKCTKKINVFVSSDQAMVNPAQTLSYITIPTLKMNAGCKITEMDAMGADRVLNSYIIQPGMDLAKVSPLNVVTAPPGLLNLLTQAVAVPASAGFSSPVDTTYIRPSHISSYGKFLSASPMILSANTGFNFSPARDWSEAVFWNPAALSGNTHASAIDLFSNFKNNLKFSGSRKVSDKITVGAGVIYTVQSEYQPTRYADLDDSVLHLQTLKEYAVFLSSAYKINNKLSVGLALKSIWQSFNLPNQVVVVQSPLSNEFIDSMVHKQQFDADISFSYSITPALRAGVNIMNIAGSELHSAAFGVWQKDMPFQELRSLGLGLSYRLKQFNFGTDLLLTGEGLYDVTVGVNYVPFNNALLSSGYAFKQKSFSASFKWKQFKISYVDDNGLMVNEKNPSSIHLFNGRIYTAVVFDF